MPRAPCYVGFVSSMKAEALEAQLQEERNRNAVLTTDLEAKDADLEAKDAKVCKHA